MILEADKAKLLARAILVGHLGTILDRDRQGRAIGGGDLLDLLLVPLGGHVLQENIRELLRPIAVLADALIA